MIFVSKAVYHEVMYMAQALPEKPSEESVWMDRVPVKSVFSVPEAVSSGDYQGAEADESPASSQS